MARKKTKVTFVIPTYNAERYLENCLKSIRKQTYKNYEILVIDGGSKDTTLKIARKYKSRILKNPRVDAESGKSIGIQSARGSVIALVDADNELVQKNWLSEMLKPFDKHKDLWGVESPWLLKKEDNLINKYFTLLQVADPVARRFHPVKMKKEDEKDYVVYTHKGKFRVPVIGANGFLWRKKFIEDINKHIPKFEEVNYVSNMLQEGHYKYAKHKRVGTYHYYSDSLTNYVQKRLKIGRKFLERKGKGQSTWTDRVEGKEFIFSIFYNLTFLGPTFEAVREYKKTGEVAWLLHPFFSFVTVASYGYTFFEFVPKFFLSELRMGKGLRANEMISSEIYSMDYFMYNCEGAKEFRFSSGGALTERLKKAFDLAGEVNRKKVLDLGCGRGELLLLCGAKGAEVTGVDYSEVALSLSRKLKSKLGKEGKKIKLVQSSVENLPFSANTFDKVFFLDIIEHLYDWQVEKALGEIRRVLKGGGELIIHTNPNRWFFSLITPLIYIYNLFTPSKIRLRGKYSTHVHVNEQSPLGLLMSLRRARFKITLADMNFFRLKERGGFLAFVEKIIGKTPFKYILFNDIWFLVKK